MVKRSLVLIFAALALSCAALSWAALAVAAETFPANVIRIFVPFSVGTPSDIISRLIAAELSESEGWRIVVEDRPGAVGTIAGSEVLRQAADGHSLYLMNAPVTAAPALLPNMPYDLIRDFAPVVRISTSYNVLVVNPSVPAKSIGEFTALLKSRPNELAFSSAGYGSPAHLIGELFMQQTGVRARHVPYQQFPQATADLLNGTNQFMFIAVTPVIGLIQSGKLRALAVTAPHRIPILPDIPTVTEEGFSGLVVENWLGFAVKSGTADAIVLRLNEAVNRALAKPKIREAIDRMGAEPIGGTAAEFGQIIKSEVTHWTKVVKDSGIEMKE
jgi:tripartite-type tricarboxylate transporter receptor subunit TctC